MSIKDFDVGPAQTSFRSFQNDPAGSEGQRQRRSHAPTMSTTNVIRLQISTIASIPST